MGWRIKAIFFGMSLLLWSPTHLSKEVLKNVRIQVDWSYSDQEVRDHADMDDTLVMTGDADLKAYTDVVKLAKRLHGKVGFLCAMPLAREHPLKLHHRE